MKIKECRKCGKKPKPQPAYITKETGWYTYKCKCGATPHVFDGTRQEAIERWNEECGK